MSLEPLQAQVVGVPNSSGSSDPENRPSATMLNGLCRYSNAINHPLLMVYTTHKNGDEWGMVYYCSTNISSKLQNCHSSVPDFHLLPFVPLPPVFCLLSCLLPFSSSVSILSVLLSFVPFSLVHFFSSSCRLILNDFHEPNQPCNIACKNV